MPRKDAGSGPISAQAQQDLVSEGIENFELPKSIVTKIAKSAMPDNAKLQKETVLSLVKGSTVFINYLVATAHDVALSKQHKSISASDVLKALEMIEFGDLVENLQNELQIYRDNTKGDKGRKSGTASSSHKGKARDSESASVVSKSKGKEKATNLPPPFTFAPRAAVASSASQSDMQNATVEQEVDDEMGEPGEGEDEEIEEEEEEIEEEGEEEAPADMMAIEDEEQRRDVAGLEEPEVLPAEG
ncbi:histone-fold-containing protein [Suillus clintonianus]|uniref:histone-fold-containing protein n=1 Tax=Suillus clintonianus TaxID=1904413 RepID=UPI001B865B17|nr:histone-fold-containing protein [Suillus clintonianus]KAG2133356.1 histone-fold-containing protein [Suillus clintonianus]